MNTSTSFEERGSGEAGGLIPTGRTALFIIIGSPVLWIAAALERGCRVQYGADMSAAQLHLVGPWWGLEIPPVD